MKEPKHPDRPRDPNQLAKSIVDIATGDRIMTEVRWFIRYRQEWIAETIRIFGFINRIHLERKFEVSTLQASHDLSLFQRENPGVIEYNRKTKRYEAT